MKKLLCLVLCLIPMWISIVFSETYPGILKEEIQRISTKIEDNTNSIDVNVKSWIEIKNANLLKQKYDYSCGTASLGTILKYFFCEEISEKEIVDIILELKGIDKKKEDLEEKDFFLSFSDLKIFAENRGYKVFGLGLSLDTLKRLKVPALIYVTIRDNDHFSVYKGIDNNFVFLADPSFGNIQIRIKRFKKIFYTRKDTRHAGKILIFVPKDEKKKEEVSRDFLELNVNCEFIYKIVEGKLYI